MLMLVQQIAQKLIEQGLEDEEGTVHLEIDMEVDEQLDLEEYLENQKEEPDEQGD